jgi:hypothetical protein
MQKHPIPQEQKEIDTNADRARVTLSDAETQEISTQRQVFHREWTDTISPNPR